MTKSLTDLNQDIEDIKAQLSTMTNPSKEYTEGLDADIKAVRENILTLNDTIAQIKEVLNTERDSFVTRLKDIKESIGDIVDPKPLAAPSSVAVIPALTSLKVSWDFVTKADEYDVFYADTNDGKYNQLPSASNNVATIPGLKLDTKYNIYVVAKTFGGELSSPSTIVTSQTLKIN